MDIASVLSPFIPEGTLSEHQLHQVSAYLDLLLKWNAKINLTSVRSPAEILTRHFGDSFFLAHQLFSCHPERSEGNEQTSKSANEQMVVDLGSGAGFPGLPLKIYAPNVAVTLIESNQKKAKFLREVIRVLRLTGINVFPSRAEDYIDGLHSKEKKIQQSNEEMSKSANEQMIVTLRAVEHFDRVLPLAARILTARSNEQMSKWENEQIASCLALLIGSSQLPTAHRLLPHFSWSAPIPVPLSHSRILLLGSPG